MTSKNPHSQVQVSGTKEQEVAKMLAEKQAEEIAAIKPQEIVPGFDSVQHSLPGEDPTAVEKPKNFDQKIYLFPDEYIALRKELVEHWPEIWILVGWLMAHNGPQFVDAMNAGLQMNLQFDTHKVGPICKKYLNRLRKQRGVSEL